MKKIFILFCLVIFYTHAPSQETNETSQEPFYNKNNPMPMWFLDGRESIEEIIIYFKRYGLFYCIHTFDKTENQDVITRSMRYYKMLLMHQDGYETKQKKLEEYINTTLKSTSGPGPLARLVSYDGIGPDLYSVACLNLYESKAYMQEIDTILRAYFLHPQFPKAYQERYKKTIQQFLGQTLGDAFTAIAPKDIIQQASSALVYEWDDEPTPSFSCDLKDTNIAESLICFSEWKYNVILDNFYTSYYHKIMQNISNDKKSELKKIAKEMINKRNKEVGQINKEEIRIKANEKSYRDKDEEEWTGNMKALDLTWQEEINIISKHYEEAIMQLSDFVLCHQADLFAKIFYKHTEEYKMILQSKEADYELILGALYFDNLIDKTGKLIDKVDSK